MKLVNCLNWLSRQCSSSSFVFGQKARRRRRGQPLAAVELLENRSLLAAPVAVDDAAATGEDTPVTFGVLGNDSDPDSDPISVIGVTDGLAGTAVVNADSTITYTPSADFIRLGQSFTDTITYTIDDGPGMGGTATAQVTITVTGVNDEPLVQLTAYTTVGEYSIDGIDDLTFDAGGSYDLESEPLTFTWLINGIALDPQPGGSILLITAADQFDLREFVSSSNGITVFVSDGIASVPDAMTLEFDTGSGSSSFASTIPAPTDWGEWAPAGNDLDISGRTSESFVQNALSKFGGQWALTTIPPLEPGGVNASPLPDEKKIGYDIARKVRVKHKGDVIYEREFPVTTPAQLARLNIRANLQRLKQDIVDDMDCLLTFSPPLDNVGNLIPMTQAQKNAVMNEVADSYIRGVDSFLESHPGAKPSLDRRSKVLHKLGLADDSNSPWCATWAESMLTTVVIPLAGTNTQTQAFLAGGDAMYQSTTYQHNWVFLCGELEVPSWIVTSVTDEWKNRMIYLDPWVDLMPRIYFDSAHNYSPTSLNEGFGT